MAAISVEGWQDPRNPKPVSLVDLIRRHAGLGLPAAKKLLDDFAEHGQIVVSFSDSRSAENFARDAREIGAVTRTLE